VNESLPDLVTMENVPQLASHPVFQSFCKALHKYHLWYGVVDCAPYGVPQTRRRLVLLASRLGPIELLSPSRASGVSESTVRRAISHLPPITAGGIHPRDPLHSSCSLSPLNLQRIRASRPGGTWRDWPRELIAKCHLRESGGTFPSVYGRMEWDAPAPTITTQCFGFGNGRFGHPEQDRAISLREAAILQTFPPTYRFLRSGEPACFYVHGRLIGNAVPVTLGHVVARSLRTHVGLTETSGSVPT
jgi:DNA (cytosine-5)-methyltransferase 1